MTYTSNGNRSIKYYWCDKDYLGLPLTNKVLLMDSKEPLKSHEAKRVLQMICELYLNEGKSTDELLEIIKSPNK